MSKRKSKQKGATHGNVPERRKAAKNAAIKPEAESSPAECRYVEERTKGKTPRQIRALAARRNDIDLVELCDGIIEGTRNEPEYAFHGAGPANSGKAEAVRDTGEVEAAVSGKGNRADTAKAARIAAIERAIDDHYATANAANGIGTAEDPEVHDPEVHDAEPSDNGDAADSGDGRNGADNTTADGVRVIRDYSWMDGFEGEIISLSASVRMPDGTTCLVADLAELRAMDGDLIDFEAVVRDLPEDTRPIVTMEELKSIDAEISMMKERIRGAMIEMRHLQDSMAELFRTRRAMGPVAREHRAGSGRLTAAGPRGISLLAAAANLLAETGWTANCRKIVQELDERGIWSSPGGKTPNSTLYASMNREIEEKGDRSRFVRADKGLYAASKHGVALFKAAQANAATADANPESD